ncbi:hypothetical protein QJS66_07210 [Kocuria rhizophila]|nr:hypothetical protein QJS66_07210 [Kocuria rhizophila]
MGPTDSRLTQPHHRGGGRSASPRWAGRSWTGSSGQAAATLAVLNLGGAGTHVVASPSLDGGSYNLLSRRRRAWARRPSWRTRTTASSGGTPRAHHRGRLREMIPPRNDAPGRGQNRRRTADEAGCR